MGTVESNPQVLGGTPVFPGTRVPVASLFDYLRRGYPITYFLSQFPTVTRPQVDAVLDESQRHVKDQSKRAAG